MAVLSALSAGRALGASPPRPPGAQSRPLVVGVVPQFEPRRLHAVWGPIVAELGRRTGLRLEMVTTLTIPEFERELAAGSYDFVYANPFHIVNDVGRQGYEPLVRDAAPLRGILVVRRDSPYRAPAELAGKVVAMPSPNALGASLLLRADLERVHHAKVTPLYVKTHSSVYLHVAKGLAEAGGGVEKTLQEQDQEVRDLLRTIYVTRPMPSHPLAAHPRVAKEAREAVRQALLAFAKTAEGRQLLARVPMKEPVATSLADFQELRAWGLERYWDASWKDD